MSQAELRDDGERGATTSAKRPPRRTRVIRCGSSGRAAASGGACAALSGGGGTLDRRDRRAARPLASDGQGVLLMRREAPCCIPGAAGRDSEEGPWV